MDAPPPTDPADRTNGAARQAARVEAVRLAAIATWELDLRTGERYWSAEYQALYGVDPHNRFPTEADFDAIVHPSDRDVVRKAIERVISDGTAMEVRYRITRPSDQAVRTIRTHIRAERDVAGRPVRIIGAAQDVTCVVMVLTLRESEMLMLLAEGLSIAEIAGRLMLSRATVRTHIQNALKKLGAHTRGQAIAMALRSQEIGL